MFDSLSILRLIVFSENAECAPVSFPVFTKQGYSSVLEFESPPLQVVIGDKESFQVERMGNSLAIRPLVSEGATNLIVYFSKSEPVLFLLKASDEAEPLLYKKIEKGVSSPVSKASPSPRPSSIPTSTKVTYARFTAKHDFLVVKAFLVAGKERLAIDWSQVHLGFKDKQIKPSSLWAERQEVAQGTSASSRFIFPKPDVPSNLAGVSLVLPLKNSPSKITLKF
jgi:hypothetical protein